MRPLTLNEKISIKGVLHRRGVRGAALVTLTMRSAGHYWNMCVRGPLAYYYKVKK